MKRDLARLLRLFAIWLDPPKQVSAPFRAVYCSKGCCTSTNASTATTYAVSGFGCGCSQSP